MLGFEKIKAIGVWHSFREKQSFLLISALDAPFLAAFITHWGSDRSPWSILRFAHLLDLKRASTRKLFYEYCYRYYILLLWTRYPVTSTTGSSRSDSTIYYETTTADTLDPPWQLPENWHLIWRAHSLAIVWHACMQGSCCRQPGVIIDYQELNSPRKILNSRFNSLDTPKRNAN